jgi:hypothetical protein
VTDAVFTASAYISLRFIPAEAVKTFIQLCRHLQVRSSRELMRSSLRIGAFLDADYRFPCCELMFS